MAKYLLELYEIGGDRSFAIVGKAGWDWIGSPAPKAFSKGSSGCEEPIPEAVLAEATDNQLEEPTVFLTAGSWENDRAIHCLSLYKTTDTRPLGRFVDTYEGVLY